MAENGTSQSQQKRNLTNEERQMIFETLLLHSERGKMKRGHAKEIAATFSTSVKSVRRIWTRGKTCFFGGLAANVSSKRPKNVGRKRLQIDFSRTASIPLRKRTNIRSLSIALRVPKSTLHMRIQEGVIRPHSNALKPDLSSEEHKRARLNFCLSMLEQSSLPMNPVFKDMYNYVHIDEKWFYLTKESEKYYLLPEEVEPLRTCKSKRFITKVMFLAAVARPRFDATRNEIFSGKIGIFPFTFQEPAKRSSKNRAAGTLETKPIFYVNKEVIRSCLIENVIPAIQEKWPRQQEPEIIYIQQDNARPHIREQDAEFCEAAKSNGFDIRLVCQPPNSPDLNVLDLGYFRAIQTLQHQNAPSTVDELVQAVEKSFEELPVESLDSVFTTLQACMIEIMKINGGNNYKTPHMRKAHLRRENNLPTQLPCDIALVDQVKEYLQH